MTRSPDVAEQPWSGRTARRGGVLWAAIHDLVTAAESGAAAAELQVLDLGGGTGGLAVPIAELGHPVTVVDPSPDALAALDRRASEHGVDHRLRGIQGDAADLLDHVSAASFDLVLCHGVLEVVDNPGQALDAIRAAMRPRATLSVVVAGRYAAVLAKAMAGHLLDAQALLSAQPASIPRRYVPDEIVALLRTHDFEPARVQAVRTFTDLIPSAALDNEPDAGRVLLELERAVAGVEALAPIAAQLHVVATLAAD
jgi:S-adenosylmethionine-dependent methyltransferase